MTAKEIIQALIDDHNYTVQEISEGLDDRVSSRTVYRWLNGETEPQRSGDLDALHGLLVRRTKGKPSPAVITRARKPREAAANPDGGSEIVEGPAIVAEAEAEPAPTL